MTTPTPMPAADRLHVVFGAGPLGRAVAREAHAQGGRVRLVTRSGGAMPGVDAVAADAMDPSAAIAACRDADVVYQCAAPAYHRWPEEFPQLQENVLQGAARAGAVLVAAENLYGYGVAGDLDETMPLVATTRKGRTRAAMSRRLCAAHAAGETRTVAGRAADFFGPEVRVSALGERVWPQLIARRPVAWLGDPDAAHSFTFVPDFARALVLLGGEPRAWGQTWHAPSPEPISLRAVLALAAADAGLPAPTIRRLPKLALRAVGLFNRAAGETVEMTYAFEERFVMSDTAFRTAFGGTATPWDAALAATLAPWRSADRAAA